MAESKVEEVKKILRTEMLTIGTGGSAKTGQMWEYDVGRLTKLICQLFELKPDRIEAVKEIIDRYWGAWGWTEESKRSEIARQICQVIEAQERERIIQFLLKGLDVDDLRGQWTLTEIEKRIEVLKEEK